MLPSSGKICEFLIAEIWKWARKTKRVCARASHVKDKSWLSPPDARVPKLWIKRISSRLLLSCSGRPALITANCMSSWWSIPAKWAGTGRATFFLMTSNRCSRKRSPSKKPWDFDLPLCSGSAFRGVNEGTGPAVTSITRKSAYLTLENLR